MAPTQGSLQTMFFFYNNLKSFNVCLHFSVLAGLDLNGVFRFVLFCFSFCFVVGGPGGGFGGPGAGFLVRSKSSGKATTETTKKKATKTTTRTSKNLQNKTKNETKQNE